MAFPPKPAFPLGLDTDYTLFQVHNTTETRLSEDNVAWSDEINIVPVDAGELEVWPDNGFATMEGELFYYDSVRKDANDRVYQLRDCARGTGGESPKFNQAGTWVRGFVVAEHHIQCVDTTITIEKYVLELLAQADCLLAEPDCVDDFNCVLIDFAFDTNEDEASSCEGIEATYQVVLTGNVGSYRLDFGDGTSTTTLSGVHTYAPNTIIDPIVTVSNDDCTVVQTPNEKESGIMPEITEDEVFQIPVPEIPDFPQITVPTIETPSVPINIPPIVFPCLDLGQFNINIPSLIDIPPINISIPSIINIDSDLNIPSIIIVIDDIPSIISVTPVDIPSVISITPVTIPTLISITPVSLPTLISITPVNVSVDVNVTIPSLQVSIIGSIDIPSVISIVPPVISFSPSNYVSVGDVSIVGSITVPSLISIVGSIIVPSTVISVVASIDWGQPSISLPPISFVNAPSFASTISFVNNPDFASTISFVNTPSWASFITVSFMEFETWASTISFVNNPDFASTISFVNTPTITETISFVNIPSCCWPSTMSFIDVPSCCWPSVISFVNSPSVDTLSVVGISVISLIWETPTPNPTVQWGTVPSVYISWGQTPSVNINWTGAPTLGIDWSGVPTLSGSVSLDTTGATVDMGTCSCVVTVQCPSSGAFMPARALGDDFEDEFDYEDGIADSMANALGIPSEIQIVPPSLSPLEIRHDLPSSISIDSPNIPTEINIIGPTTPIPAEIHLTGMELPRTISVIADIPSVITLDTSSLPSVMQLEILNPIPATIFIDASDIPREIQVTGVPDTIELIHNLPDAISLTVPEDLEVPLVYKGGPIPIQFDPQNLSGDLDDETPCFAIVPCPKK